MQLAKTICIKHSLQVHTIKSVRGGDISSTFKASGKAISYFIKINAAKAFPGLFNKEVDGLNALRKATSLRVPQVLACGELQNQQYLVLEWLERIANTSQAWETLGEGIAMLHRNTNDLFGYHESNYIGSIIQKNDYYKHWSQFYAEQRILPLVKKLVDTASFSAIDALNAEKTCAHFNEIFPVERPALLHGDLWSGNFMFCQDGENGEAAIFDPAVYYGHREMDIGMSLLFGGFDKRFYAAYDNANPLEKNWQQRVLFTQLYPLLVHAVLFSGNYINQCKRIFKHFA